MYRKVAALLLVAIAGCSDPTAPPVPQPPSISISELQAAPETLVVANLPVAVRVGLSRDFAPELGPSSLSELVFEAVGLDGGPLAGWAQLRIPGDSGFPSQVAEVYIWVINGNQVWPKVMIRRSYDLSPPDQVDLVSGSCGPRWGPGLLVDVAIGVRDVQGQLSLSLVRSVPITRTD